MGCLMFLLVAIAIIIIMVCVNYLGWFITAVLWGGLAIYLFNIQKDTEKKDKEKDKERGILLKDTEAKYIGGFPEIEGGLNATIELKKDVIIVSLSKGLSSKGMKFIPMRMVTNAEIKSESQITQEVGLGKMIVFGALAFAMKSSKSTIKNYLVISCEEKGNKRDLIFESDKASSIVRQIRSIKGISSTF